MDEDILERIQQADWPRIALELAVYAARKLRRLPPRVRESVGRRLCPDDLAYSAIEAVVAGPGRSRRASKGERAWDPDRDPDLLTHLKGVVDSLVSSEGTGKETELARAYHRTKDDEEVEKPPPVPGRAFDPPRSEWSSGPPANPEQLLLDNEDHDATLERILSAVDGDDELTQVLEALMEGNEKPAEIAESTGMDVKRVYQLKRRLKARIEATQGATHG